MNLKDRIVLITGSARIGQSVGKILIDQGAHLILTYRTSKSSAKVLARYGKSKARKVLLIKTDLTLNKNLADTISKVKNAFGHLDVLINMASVYVSTPLNKLSWETWERAMDANLKHVYYLSLKSAGLMKKGGRIINFADWTVQSGRPRYKNLIPYYTAKAGVIALTEVLALELAPDILVNSIAPGPILPPASGMTKKTHREVINNTPLKKWGGAEEIAKAVLFLIDSNFVTGECIRVDGGRHLF